MTEFSFHTQESAPIKSQALLAGVNKGLGFIPNLMAGMAESPAMLEAYIQIGVIFDKTNLSATERQIILMSNNLLNNCTYCMAAHTTLSQMAKVPEDVIHSLRTNTPLVDPKLEALRQFSIKVNESRGYVSDEDITELLTAGYDEATVLDVVLGTSFKVMSNYTNHMIHTPVDEQFSANRWDKSDIQA